LTATNHAITGATIGLLVGAPELALPFAFVSHFICDSIPHLNYPEIKSSLFKKCLMLDATGCFLIVLILTILHPHNWLQACFCAFVASSPDFFWLNRFLRTRRQKSWKPSLFSKFASGIQWFQKPAGGVVELTWLLSGIFVIHTIIG
jgi:hypothetical protein